MPISVGVATLIAGAAAAGSQIIGSKLNSNAAHDAGTIQLNAANQALTYEKERQARQDQIDAEQRAYDRQQTLYQQQYQQQQGQAQIARRQPFVGAGTNAVYRLNDLLGRSNQNSSGPGPVSNIMTVTGPPPPAPPPTTAAPTTPGGVMMIAPDGTSMQVPGNRVDEALSKGAKLAPGATQAPGAPATSNISSVANSGPDKAASADASMPGATPSGSAMTPAMVDPTPGGSTGIYSNRYINMTDPKTGEMRPVLFGNVGDLSRQGWVATQAPNGGR